MKIIKPEISIIVPVYKVELYSRKCIDSMSNKIEKVIKINYRAYNYRTDNESITRSKISKK